MTGADENTVRIGKQAAVFLADETFKSAITAIRDDAMRQFKSARAGDIESLQVARIQYDVTERFINHFVTFVDSGKLAADRIERAKRK